MRDVVAVVATYSEAGPKALWCNIYRRCTAADEPCKSVFSPQSSRGLLPGGSETLLDCGPS